MCSCEDNVSLHSGERVGYECEYMEYPDHSMEVITRDCLIASRVTEEGRDIHRCYVWVRLEDAVCT